MVWHDVSTQPERRAVSTRLHTEIRRLRGLHTQEQFATLAGVTRVTVSLWESGKQVPGLRAARRLVELGLDIAYVLPTAPAPTDARAELSERGAA